MIHHIPFTVRDRRDRRDRGGHRPSWMRRLAASATMTTTILGFTASVWASSHRDAPTIAEDPTVDNTDLYVFLSPSDPDRVVFAANYQPFLMPTSGPNFYRFSDSAQYEIAIDNDGDAQTDIVYRWSFRTQVGNTDTILYNTGPISAIDAPTLNVRQFYSVHRINAHTGSTTVAVQDAPVAPWNIGSRSFPSNSYDSVAAQAVIQAGDVSLFAGPRDDSFFADLNVFDLLGIAGNPTLAGFNVMTIAIELPLRDVVSGGVRPSANSNGPATVIGVHARATRPKFRVIVPEGDSLSRTQVQVSRVAIPLLNIVLLPLSDVDIYNRISPASDLARFETPLRFPEITGLLNAVLGAGCRQTPAAGRDDIIGLLSPAGTQPADLLRLDIRAGQTFADGGFPNGRRLEDDVVDTLLTAVCDNGQSLGDGVNQNDLPFSSTMPYLAAPHSGNP